jgi:hypothetical protein
MNDSHTIHARVHTLARLRAQAMRDQAIADFWGGLVTRLQTAAARLPALHVRTLRMEG